MRGPWAVVGVSDDGDGGGYVGSLGVVVVVGLVAGAADGVIGVECGDDTDVVE